MLKRTHIDSKLIIEGILKRILLLGLHMQPKQEIIGEDGAKSDPHILTEWLRTKARIDSPNSINIINGFNRGLDNVLKDPNTMQEYRLAMARLIKASLATGTFVEGRKREMEDFLLRHPKVAEFLKNNLEKLDVPNTAIGQYIKNKQKENPHFKILPKTQTVTEAEKQKAQLGLQASRKKLSSAIQSTITSYKRYNTRNHEEQEELKYQIDTLKTKEKRIAHSRLPTITEKKIAANSKKMEETLAHQHQSRLREQEEPISQVRLRQEREQRVQREERIKKPKGLLNTLQEKNKAYMEEYTRNKDPKARTKRTILWLADTDKKYTNAQSLDEDIEFLKGYPHLDSEHVEVLLKTYEELENEAMGAFSSPGRVAKMLEEAGNDLQEFNKPKGTGHKI